MKRSLPTWITPPALVIGAAILVQLVGVIDEGDTIPLSIQFGQSLVLGSSIALITVGIVLVYRSSRVVTFSQAGFGTAAAMLFLCLYSIWGWPFWLAFGGALVAAMAAGVLVEVFIIRRFAHAPRLVLTVATIALAQGFGGLTLFMPRLFGLFVELSDESTSSNVQLEIHGNGAANATAAPQSPFERFRGTWDPWQFDGDDLFGIAVAIVAMAALAWFFRRTPQGVAVRGVAENRDRAALLGINPSTLSSLVWALAAGLAAIGALASSLKGDTSIVGELGRALLQGSGVAEAIGASTLIRALAAAVVARMENLPVAVASAFGIAVFHSSVFWTSGQTAMVDAAMLLLIVGALLFQRARGGRLEAVATSSWEATEEIRAVPSELAPMPQVRAGLRRALWIGGIVVAAYPWVMSPSQTNHGGVFALYGIVGVSLVILTGWAGQISLGQFGFVAIGALVGGAVTGKWGLPFPVALVVGSLVSTAVAVAVGIPALRIRGLYLAVTTLAFSVTVATVVLSRDWFGWLMPSTVKRPQLLWIDTDADERAYYYICLAGLAFAIFVASSLRRSRTGRLLIAMRDNESFARAHGINAVRTRLTAFGVSGFLCGVAGVLFVHHQEGLTVAAYGPEQSIQMFLMAVIGGLGNTYTVLAGALYVASITFLSDNAYVQLFAGSLGVLTILLFFPQGLGALLYRARDSWLRRIALRNRINVPSLLGDRVDGSKVVLGERLRELGDIPEDYVLDSEIGVAGRSQLTRVWTYD